MIFSDEEIKRRWDAVRVRLGPVDCAVVPSFHNSYYLSGVPILQWGRFAITLLFRDSDPVLVIPAFEASAAAASSPIRDVRLYQDDQGPSLQTATARAVEALRERRVTAVGIEAGGMPAAMYLLLQALLPGTPLRDVTQAIDDVRMVSSPEEIAYIREACRIAAAGLYMVLDLIQPGVEEACLSTQARLAMERQAGSRFPVSTTCYMQQGERSLECHAASSSDTIRAGQVVEVVCECEVVHYQGAVERCLLVGEAAPEVERAYAVMLKAFEAALDAARPGVSFADVDRAARRVLIEAGYDRITNGSGLIQMDGGLLNLKRSAGLCEAAGIPVLKHSLGELGVAVCAAAHVMASTPNFVYANQSYASLLADDVVEGGPLPYVNGHLAVPPGPGLGVRVDVERVARYADLYQREGALFAFHDTAALSATPVLPKM